jgi:hypothetical protein
MQSRLFSLKGGFLPLLTPFAQSPPIAVPYSMSPQPARMAQYSQAR